MTELFFQNFPIKPEVISSVKYVTATNYISQLLPQLYDGNTLMTHSLHGRKANKFKDGETLKMGFRRRTKRNLLVS